MSEVANLNVEVGGCRLSACNDANQLQQLLDSVENFDERKLVRARLKQVKDVEKVERDEMLARIQNQREISIQKKLKDAHDDKQRYFKMYESMSKPNGVVSERPASTCLSMSQTARDYPKAVLSARDKFKMLDQQSSATKSTSTRPLSASFACVSNRSSPCSPGSSSSASSSPASNSNFKTAKDRLLQWAQLRTKAYDNVDIVNFSSSWSDGLAFCALIHSYFPDAFDYAGLDAKNRRKNFDLAFKVAEERGAVYPLLEVDDMIVMGHKPDWKCVFTYVISIYNTLKKLDAPL